VSFSLSGERIPKISKDCPRSLVNIVLFEYWKKLPTSGISGGFDMFDLYVAQHGGRCSQAWANWNNYQSQFWAQDEVKNKYISFQKKTEKIWDLKRFLSEDVSSEVEQEKSIFKN
jgi:inhibitor of KinA sporulation pathway (predicted exonuclease)